MVANWWDVSDKSFSFSYQSVLQTSTNILYIPCGVVHNWTCCAQWPLARTRDISFDIDWKEGEVGQWPLFFFFLAKIWSCRKMPCHQCSVSSWAACFLSPVNKLFCVSSLAAAELMRRILSIELCHGTCWTSCYFHKSLIIFFFYLQWCFSL